MPRRKLSDDYLHLGHRRRLVTALRARGIDHPPTLEAFGRVPRHWFVPRVHEARAYEDRALPIARGQTISQPYTVAYQTSLLRPAPRLKVLEVGTGSGYQAAILGTLGMRVFTLERHEALYQSARTLFADRRFGDVRCFLRDGFRGLPAHSPFDRILVTAGAETVPPALLEQLGRGGVMVIPVGREGQVMRRITRADDGTLSEEDFGQFRFVPFLEGLATEYERREGP